MRQISNLKFKTAHSSFGFTLIELLIVISVIGILASLAVSNFQNVRLRGRDVQRKADLARIASALEAYNAENHQYPGNARMRELIDPIRCNTVAFGEPIIYSNPNKDIVYLNIVPCDPLNSGIYKYNYTSSQDGFKVVACLENPSDSQKDSSVDSACGAGNTSYTIEHR